MGLIGPISPISPIRPMGVARSRGRLDPHDIQRNRGDTGEAMKANNGLTRRRRWCLRLGLLVWLALPGCVAWGEKRGCEDIPPGAIPPCTGTHTQEIFRTQAEIAEADDF